MFLRCWNHSGATPVISCALQNLSLKLIWNNGAAPCLPWSSPQGAPHRPKAEQDSVASCGLAAESSFHPSPSTHPKKSPLWLLGCTTRGLLWQNPAVGRGRRDKAVQNLGQIRSNSKESSGLGFNPAAALQMNTGAGQKAIPVIYTFSH